MNDTIEVRPLNIYLYNNPPMRCDKRTQWLKNESWIQPIFGPCANLGDAAWNNIDLPPVAAGKLMVLFSWVILAFFPLS